MKRRIISLFLAVVMIVLAIPAVILPTFGATVDVSYKTGFSDSFITTEYSANKAHYTNGTKIEFPVGWEIAVMSPTEWGKNYLVSNVSNENGNYFDAQNGGTWMSTQYGGGFYFSTGQLVAPINYSGSGNDRTFNKLEANVLVRYTAEFGGTVSIDVSKLNFVNTWNVMFCILVNGQPVGQFAAAEGFDYATGTGWFVPTATTSASAINTVTNVPVKKGDVIDFVFRGTGADMNTKGITFDYNNCKRLCNDWAFEVTYSDVEMPSTEGVITSFNILNNFPVADYKNAYNNGWSAFVEPSKSLTFDYTDKAWQLGSLNVSYDESMVTSTAKLEDYLSVGTTFSPYTFVGKNSSNSEFFIVNDNNGMNGATGAGKSGSIYVSRGGSDKAPVYTVAMSSGINYTSVKEGDAYVDMDGDGKGDDGTDRKVTNYTGTATIRYVAQFSGKASVALDATWKNTANKGYEQMWIILNGEPIEKIVHDSQDIKKTLDVTLTAGDTLDFVCVADPVYSALALNEKNENFYREDIKTFSLNANRRNVNINNIEVTYEEGALAGDISVWNANSVTNGFDKNSRYPFFTWYNAEGKELSHGTALDSTCTAKISDTIKAWAGITDDMTLEQAYAAYWQKYMQVNKLTYKSDKWQMVAMDKNGNAQTIAYTYGWHSIPFASVTKGDGAKTYYAGDGQYIASAEAMAKLQADLWTNLIKKSGLDATTKVAKVEMAYNVNLKDAFVNAGGSPSFATSTYYIRPSDKGSTNTYGGYEYTVQNTGFLKIALTDIIYSNAGTFTWNIAVNGKYQFATAQSADITTDAGKQALKDAIGALSIPVNAGDTVTVCFARNAAGGATFLAPSFKVTENYAPTVKATSTVNLVISDSYAVNATVTPGVENGEVDVIVDGEVIATLNPENGYICTVKSGIKVNELTASKNATKGQDGTTVSYKLREEVNGHIVTSSETFSKTTNEMLAWYEANGDETTVALAKQIRHLAAVSHWIKSGEAAIKNEDGSSRDMTTEEKNWIKCGGKDNFFLYGLKEVDGNAVASAETGSIFTNWDSGLTDRTLATLKGLTAEDYYKSYWYKTEGDDTKKYAHFNPVEGVSALVKGVDFGYAEGTNFKEFPYVIAGANVNLGDKLSLVLVIAATEDANIWALKNGYTLTAVGEGVNVTDNGFAGVTAGGKEYIGIIVDVPVSAYDKTLDIVIKDADGNPVSQTMKYSVKAWCVNKYVFGDSSFNNYLVRAVYNVGVAAADYQAEHPQPAN